MTTPPSRTPEPAGRPAPPPRHARGGAQVRPSRHALSLGVHALSLAALALPLGAQGDGAAPPGPSFVVRFTADAWPQPFTGRVLLFLSKTEPEPRLAGELLRLDPVIGAEHAGVRPGQPMVIDARNALSFPVPLRDLEGGPTTVQAVLDVDPGRAWPGTAPGNPMSAPLRIDLHPADDPRIELVCDRVVPRPELRETRWSRIFELRSELLSRFHGRPTTMRALVHLPEAWYAEPERRFPVHLFLAGFGASLEGFEAVDWPAPPLEGVPMLMVYPDPSCASGHTGFADSDVNGPWGRAFVEELLPALEAEYRGVGERDARFLVGHSSGGWGALWLMTSYPETFGYAWASSPDPVDFRDFMGVDLYAEGANLFYDEQGRLRPFCRLGNVWTVGFTKEHSAREEVLRGGVLRYFEALHGRRGADGEPRRLWDRATGAIDPAVARDWARYDLGRILTERWAELGPALSGRVSITMGDRDNFLLQGSVALLQRDLAARGADLRVRLVSGDHFSVRSYDRYQEEVRAMVSTYRAWEEQSAAQGPTGP